MTTIGVASVKGAGGVTSAALVLAAVLRRARTDVMLVEADPSGGSLLGWCEQLQPAGDLYDVTMSRNSAGLASVAQPSVTCRSSRAGVARSASPRP